jgi:hypothetical protein
MSSEKQNKMPAWKESLLQWEQSAGAAEQQDMLWDKLQVRLQPASAKWKVYFFRAAAIVLFLLVIGFLLIQKPKRKADPVVSVPPVIKNEQPPAAQKESIIPVKSVTPSVKLTRSHKPGPLLQPSPEEKIVLVDESVPVIGQQSPAPAEQVAVTPPKKKLRVVHMNELNAPPPPAFATLKDELMPSLRSAEDISLPPSIWPGKNKIKPPVLLGN